MNEVSRRRQIFVLLVITTITLISLDAQGFGPIKSAQNGIRAVLSPIGSAVSSASAPIASAWKGLTDYDDLEKENQELRDQLEAYRGASLRASTAEEALETLLDEVDIDFVAGSEAVTAQIVKRPGNLKAYSVQIDRGSNDGITQGMPVINSAGLVGKITSVEANRAEVRLLHQPEFAIGVRVVGRDAVALAIGDGEGQDLRVTHGIDQQADVSAGDPVVTSGIEGSSYPPDLVIGTVSEVVFDSTKLQQEVRITPAADLANLRFVTVLLWTVNGPAGQ